ncbi:MAG TPA: hypothetical protein GXX42_13930 [Petrimonas sp.]|nr:hypothetical protein [Petrimonas sp.]
MLLLSRLLRAFGTKVFWKSKHYGKQEISGINWLDMAILVEAIQGWYFYN